MKQFTPEVLAQIRQRAQRRPEFITYLQAENDTILHSDTLVPETGVATWNLYYFCPHHSVRLIWDRYSPTEHRCPIDQQVFQGEPYVGAWWRWLNGLNAKACYQLGLLWQLTGEVQYFAKVRELLLTYARYYPAYQVHGGIPHNGPGKANAQTLCEANCHLHFALGYDLIADRLSATERDIIATRLLRTGAEFLIEHRTPQRHNHEVKINSTIAVIGLVLDDPAYLHFALYTPYGLRYQLEQGLFTEGLWFEGSIHYHFYALEGFWAFEKLARGTQYSLLDTPHYRKMLSFPLALLMPDSTFPRLNDCIAGQEKLNHSHIYEFAYSVYGDEPYAAALHHIYQQQPRLSLDALLYGVDSLPPVTPPLLPDTSLHAADCGLTIVRYPAAQRALLVKHAPYGGEHDHHDRLGILLFNHGDQVLPDLGTTGYGAAMHYGYYKNSATHNTLTVNQSNQPPAVPQVLGWHQQAEWSWLDCQVTWCDPPDITNKPLDMGDHVPWNSQAYRDIVFRRRFICLADVVIDISEITNPHQQQLNWTLHVDGCIERSVGDNNDDRAPESKYPPDESFSNHGPLQRMLQVRHQPLEQVIQRQIITHHGSLSLWLASTDPDEKPTLFQGLAPSNPAVSELHYLVLRTHRAKTRMIAAYDFSAQNPLQQLILEQQGDHLLLTLQRHHSQQYLRIGSDAGTIPEVVLVEA